MIQRLVDIAVEHAPACLRLAPLPPPTPLPRKNVPNYRDIGIVEKGSPYRVATQPAIWRTDVLAKLLVPGFSAWDFEQLGTTMSEYMDEAFWSPMIPYIVYDHGVEKGKWKPAGLKICRDASIEVDLSARPAFTEDELEAHLDSGVGATGLHDLKMTAIREYLHGRRMDGTRFVTRYLKRRPFSGQLWAILLFGSLGPCALQWLRRTHLNLAIARLRRQHGKVT
jgi:hypothetical protein